MTNRSNLNINVIVLKMSLSFIVKDRVLENKCYLLFE